MGDDSGVSAISVSCCATVAEVGVVGTGDGTDDLFERRLRTDGRDVGVFELASEALFPFCRLIALVCTMFQISIPLFLRIPDLKSRFLIKEQYCKIYGSKFIAT